MKLAAVLAAKGNRVFTIRAEAAVSAAIAELARNNIGALVVVGADGRPTGILSERDIIRGFSASASATAARIARRTRCASANAPASAASST